MFNEIMTIDPGMTTAYAYWTGTLHPKVESFTSANRMKEHTMLEDLYVLWAKFDVVLERYPELHCCYIEGVAFWTHSLRSVTAASRGNLSKLAYLVGGYASLCHQKGLGVHLVNPTEWKGQLPDDVVARRQRASNDAEYKNMHITCAVAMGLSLQGLL